MKKTGLIYHPDYLKHKTGLSHPESPERLKACLKALKKSQYSEKLHEVNPTSATVDQVAYVHDPDYIQFVKSTSENGGMLDFDTVVSVGSFDIALLAVGGALRATDAVMSNEVDNAFCLIRPPGHHALPKKGMGFCLFNNVAISARYLQKEHDLQRILIVDWDLHHGNGTQEIFYGDNSVFYFSIHAYPYYPGTGAVDETGADQGSGFTLNIPMSPLSSPEDYINAFEDVLKPNAFNFEPDFVLISAGFDAHEDDPLGRMKMTTEAYGKLTEIVCEIADNCCDGRVVSLLEGGYNLKALSASVVEHIAKMLGDG